MLWLSINKEWLKDDEYSTTKNRVILICSNVYIFIKLWKEIHFCIAYNFNISFIDFYTA